MRRFIVAAAILGAGGIAAGCAGVGATTAPTTSPAPSTTSITSRATLIPSRLPSTPAASTGAAVTGQQLMQVADQEKSGESTQWQQCVANWLSDSLPTSELQTIVDDTTDQLLNDPTIHSDLVQANEACARS